MKVFYLLIFTILITGMNCERNKKSMKEEDKIDIIFLHHSTGYGVWKGNTNKYLYKLTELGTVEKLVNTHNRKNKTNYTIKEQSFPKREPYGWNNYPFDYYNIWVKNSGDKPYIEEPTLEILTKKYDVIVLKHCFPVSNIQEDDSTPFIDSDKKTVENYKLQYKALKQKMHEFTDTKFVLWTGAALTKAKTDEETAKRACQFFNWVKKDWNEDGDNIYIWDFREIETEGGLYLKDEYASNPNNSHPNKELNAKAAKLFVNRLMDVIENDGKTTSLMGMKL